MARTHYEALGVAENASATEIRQAHRRLVLLHHPDRSQDPASKNLFLEIQAAYEVLGDATRRREYDQHRERMRRLDAGPRVRTQTQTQTRSTSTQGRPQVRAPEPTPIAAEVLRLSRLFGQGRQAEAIDLARSILERDSRQPLPYAILGDIARARGDLNTALKHYAYAAQFDPRNEAYQRRYEELLNGVDTVSTRMGERAQARSKSTSALGAACVIAAALAIGAAFVQGTDAMPVLALLGGFAAFFVSGALAVGWWVDRLSVAMRSASGAAGPGMLVIFCALVNLGMGAGMYLLVGLAARSFHRSLTAWLTAMLALWGLFVLPGLVLNSVPILALALILPTSITFGGLCGWALGDALR